jgi:hypothetical protein
LAVALASSPLPAQEPVAGEGLTGEAANAYWQVRLLERAAGNRVCAITDFPRYDDPASPLRAGAERMLRIEAELNARDPRAIADNQPHTPFPPPQTLCDDATAAHHALAQYEASLTQLEHQLGLSSDGASAS